MRDFSLILFLNIPRVRIIQKNIISALTTDLADFADVTLAAEHNKLKFTNRWFFSTKSNSYKIGIKLFIETNNIGNI